MGKLVFIPTESKNLPSKKLTYIVAESGGLYGEIIASSPTVYIANRDSFYGIPMLKHTNHIVNIRYNARARLGRYPGGNNFPPIVIKAFEQKVMIDWKEKYGDDVWGFECLTTSSKSSEMYLKANWSLVNKKIWHRVYPRQILVLMKKV